MIAEWIVCDYKKLEHGEIEVYPNKGVYCSNCRTGFKRSDVIYMSKCPRCGAEMKGDTK